MPQPLTDDQAAEYAREGFVIARGFFDAAEIDLLRRAAKEDRALDEHSFGRADGEGGTVRLSLWNHPGDGIYGMFARCERMVRSAEKLLGGEVYHYPSKMIMKDARVGGAWTWHQDYGYWYNNGVLFPNLVSVSIAVDPSTRENGCLQVIRGSHRAGRVEHGVLPGEQVGFQAGQLTVNGRPLPEPYLKWPCKWERPPVQLGPDEFFVVGDNRTMPIENHEFGAAKRERILGRLML